MTGDRDTQPTTTVLDLPEEANRLHVTFSPDYLDLTEASGERELTVDVADMELCGSTVLVMDCYLFDHPGHPEGHFCWSSFDVEPGQRLRFTVVPLDNGGVRFEPVSRAIIDSWTNEASVDPTASGTVLLHLVLRHRLNNQILSIQSTVAFRRAEALEDREPYLDKLREDTGADGSKLDLGFNWPARRTVNIVAKSLPSADHVAGSPGGVYLSRVLARHGIPYRLYATEFDPRLRGWVASTRELIDDWQRSDVVIVIHDDGEPNLSWLKNLRCRKAFLHLGVPAIARLAAFDAEADRNHQVARAELPNVALFDILAATSRSAARELAHALEQDANSETSTGKSRKRSRKAFERQVLICRLVDREQLWASISAGGAEAARAPFLLCLAHLGSGNDFARTLEVFDCVAKRLPSIKLIAAGARPHRVYQDYLESLVASRFAHLGANIELLGAATDGRLKSLMQTCQAVIHTGPVSSDLVCDAALFGKPLLVEGATCGARRAVTSMVRLYGSKDDMADAIGSIVDGARPIALGKLDSARADDAGCDVGDLLECLLALPLPD